MIDTANILGSILFGGIGLVACVYGKKQENFKAFVIGILLMVYPYLVQNSIALFAIGTVLTVMLFIG